MRKLSILTVVSLAICQTPAPTLPAAIARLQANDPAGAAAILEELVKREPGNGRAWRNLGLARQTLKEFDRAIEAYRRALEAEPTVPSPLYAIGITYASANDKEHAFEWLAKARASRKIDMTQIETETALESLKPDPRFAALRPGPKDFQDPFVEPVKILREWDGESAGDQFGWIARSLGDVDGDGVSDVVTSAPTKAVNGPNAGRVYVYSTRTGKRLWTADGSPGDQLGTGIEAAGDTNHDGIPDVIASSPYGGYAKVYSGRDGRVLLTLKAESRADRFGLHVAGVGDVNHDGFADVIVGAPGAGHAFVYSGKDGRLLATMSGEREGDSFGNAVAGFSDKLRTLLIVGAPRAGERSSGRAYVYDSLTAKPKFVIDSDDTGGALGGMFLSVPGDVDGDGVPDVYASDWQNRAKGPATGRIYVHSGKDGKRLLTLTGEGPGEGFGTSSSVAGDVDGDGHADLIVGAWQYSKEALGAGRAYLYSGKDGSLVRTYTCRVPGDAFGFDAVTLGDIDGSGVPAFLITSAWSGIHGFHSGRIFIIAAR